MSKLKVIVTVVTVITIVGLIGYFMMDETFNQQDEANETDNLAIITENNSIIINQDRTVKSSRIDPEEQSFEISGDNRITVLKDSYDGENFYFLESTDEYMADVYIHNIESGESELVLADIFGASGMCVADGCIAGWKPLTDGRKALFVYNTETDEMRMLEPYGKGIHYQINGFVGGRLFFTKKQSSSEEPNSIDKTMHIYDWFTDETRLIEAFDNNSPKDSMFIGDEIVISDRYLLMRAQIPPDYQSDEFYSDDQGFVTKGKNLQKLPTAILIYDLEEDEWLAPFEMSRNAFAYYDIAGDYIVWIDMGDDIIKLMDSGIQHHDQYYPLPIMEALMGYHIPTGKSVVLSDRNHTISYVVECDENAVYYFEDNKDPYYRTEPVFVKVSLDSDVTEIRKQMAMRTDKVALKINPLGEWVVLLMDNGYKHVYDVYNLEQDTMFSLDFVMDDIEFDLRACRWSMFQSHGDKLLEVAHPDSDETAIRGIVYSLE